MPSFCAATKEGQYAAPCVFPFYYRGVRHEACTIWDDVSYWCPTKVLEIIAILCVNAL